MSDTQLLIESLRECNDFGNCMWCQAKSDGTILYTEALGWLMWSGTHWRSDNAGVIRFVTAALQARATEGVKTQNELLTKSAFPSATHVKSTVYLLQSYASVPVTEFDPVPHHLNCLNGVIDLRNGDLIPHDHRQRQTYCLDIEYVPGAESALWEELLPKWLGPDINLRMYTHRLMGYAITGDTREEVFAYFYGPPRSGKGTFLNTIHAILGPLSASTDMDTFLDRKSGRNFALASLINARFVQAQETRPDQWLNPALLKTATGRDPISVEHKYKAPFTAVPQWLIVLASNWPPKAPPDDTAFWESRMRVISFPNSNVGHEDRTIKETLLTTENKQGILAWLVRGAMAWYKHGLGKTPTTVVETTQQMRSLSDSLGRWLSEGCVMDDNAECALKLLHAAYVQWCDDEGVPAAERYPAAELTRRLIMRGLSARRTTLGGRGGHKDTLIKGVKLA
jgi:putative DNA primase/helicase